MREIGRLEDGQGREIVVGADRGRVTLRTLHTRTDGAVELTSDRAEEFAQMFVSACWEAGRQGGAP